ncbi:hypothetical protein 8F11_50 [uncultured Caudovirales phage]|uniref:Uncharacterized protein n=1 Tax=uncultured Caudovirales phage TaxID=2100421 RepID=A0A2H4IZQ1_9CAUD|nr:hypothetical protein 8F11_50 [uncultured Caudovirales phage]
MSRYTDLQRRLSDITSGAPIGTIEYFGQGYAKDERGFLYSVKSVEQAETQRRIAKQKAEGRKEKFVFNVMENVEYVSSALTSAQCGYLLVLSTYINYDGLIVTSERDGEPMSRQQMIAALGLRETQRSTLSEFITACVSYGIFREDCGGYSINNGFHTRGKTDNPNVVRSYITKLRAMASVNKPEHIGLLYKLIPYINKFSNVLCENPNEEIPSKRSKLNRKQIAEITGVAPSYVTRITSTMIYNEKSVFAKVTTATEGTFYMLNPTIFRRADRDDYDDTTRDIFGID